MTMTKLKMLRMLELILESANIVLCCYFALYIFKLTVGF